MRILYLGNNWVGWQVLRSLMEQNEDVRGFVAHPAARRRFGDEMLSSADLDPSRVFDGSRLRDSNTFQAIKALQADLALSVFFGYILEPRFIELFPAGVVNLHGSYLPFNRGANPNVWSIVDKTQAGATLHYIDAGVDTGDKIAQKRVPVDPVDTGETLYRKLELASVDLFKETWPLIRARKATRTPQNAQDASYHRAQDVGQIDEISLDDTYKAGELIDIIRALTFPPYPGAYFWEAGRKVYIRCQLLYEEDL